MYHESRMKIANPTARLGEDLACKYLLENGYKIIERNFRQGYGEIDIIALDTSEIEPILAFIEVKTRKTSGFGAPLESITYFKLQTLIKTAQFYKHTHKGLPDALRIDGLAVELTFDNKTRKIELVKNIGS